MSKVKCIKKVWKEQKQVNQLVQILFDNNWELETNGHNRSWFWCLYIYTNKSIKYQDQHPLIDQYSCTNLSIYIRIYIPAIYIILSVSGSTSLKYIITSLYIWHIKSNRQHRRAKIIWTENRILSSPKLT